MRDLVVVAGVVGTACVVVWMVRVLARRMVAASGDTKIAGLIASRGAYGPGGARWRFEGFDAGLREATARKRAVAMRSRTVANGVESTATNVDQPRPLTFERKTGHR